MKEYVQADIFGDMKEVRFCYGRKQNIKGRNDICFSIFPFSLTETITGWMDTTEMVKKKFERIQNVWEPNNHIRFIQEKTDWRVIFESGNYKYELMTFIENEEMEKLRKRIKPFRDSMLNEIYENA